MLYPSQSWGVFFSAYFFKAFFSFYFLQGDYGRCVLSYFTHFWECLSTIFIHEIYVFNLQIISFPQNFRDVFSKELHFFSFKIIFLLFRIFLCLLYSPSLQTAHTLMYPTHLLPYRHSLVATLFHTSEMHSPHRIMTSF